MKTFRKFLLLPALVLAFNARAAANNDAATFSGTVVDAQGNPVADATVDFYQYAARTGPGPVDLEAKQQTKTDAHGAFALPLFQGEGIAVATQAGFAPGWQMWISSPLETAKIALGKPSVLAGVVMDDTGQPVADAEVSVVLALNKSVTAFGQPNLLFGKIPRDLFSARTSADGKFRIENFPAGAQAMFSVKKAGKALHPAANPAGYGYTELPYHAGQEDITLTLDPAGSISGKVVTRDSAQPLANAVVSLQPVAPAVAYFFSPEFAVSAADGSFQISDVPAGSYQVVANFTNKPIADWVADPVPVTVTAGETVPGLRISAYKGGVLEVTVRGQDHHESLANATVSVSGRGENFTHSSSTGTNGLADFRLPPGQYTVFANKPDWAQAQVPAKVTEGQTTLTTVELGAPFRIAGVVRDASGAPVAGATVGVFPNFSGGNTGTRTDANGHYAVNWTEPTWGGAPEFQFNLIARQVGRNLAAIHAVDESTTNLDVTLMPAMSLSVRVKDPEGNPITNAVAYVTLHQENSSFSMNRQRVHSDAQGRLQMDALPRGKRYGWSVSARGYGSAQVAMDTAEPNADHHDFPPLTLQLANRKLAGRVLGTNGAPVAGAQIWMHGDGQPSGNAFTDARGRFVFDAVCAGPVSVSANLNGLSGSADVMGGDTNVVIRFNAQNRVYMAAAPQTLTGTVYGPSGNPAAGVRVVVTPAWGAMAAAKTDAHGNYSLNWQPQPGGMRNMKYFAIARDVERNLAAITAIRTNQTSATLRLGPGLSISGTVHDAKGAPLTHANVNLNMMAGNVGGLVEYGRIRLKSDGTFTIPALPRGQQYMLFVNANGYGSAQKTVGKTASRTDRIRLAPFRLKPADRQLAGRVVGRDNQPLAGAQVNINGNGQPSGNTRTDATGHFHFKVCDGPVQIFAWSPSGSGRYRSGTAYARGGDTDVVVKMGARPSVREMLASEPPLKPQAWTLGALLAWPSYHKTGMILLLSLQAVVLLATGGGVFWFTRQGRQG